jgi:hypothetical protein
MRRVYLLITVGSVCHRKHDVFYQLNLFDRQIQVSLEGRQRYRLSAQCLWNLSMNNQKMSFEDHF